ncbi:glycoside hydrolase family 95 protein [Millionella massiliensis]|uniref:glycoside hydrolase family 95 protein n=1 Tax=Millionella massiliensis TaxID=1871023 RepID=UPI0024B77085|nr:glycoside hydrolase family 95 protein [Millionella massiliensis]
MKHKTLTFLAVAAIGLTPLSVEAAVPLKLTYDRPAKDWMTEALPIGNGYMGAMFFGTPMEDVIQFSEESLWEGGPETGGTYDGGNKIGAWKYLAPVRALLDSGQLDKAYALANSQLTGRIDGSKTYPGGPSFGDYGAQQTFGEVLVRTLPMGADTDTVSDYRRELDIAQAVGGVSYRQGAVDYSAEYWASYPKRVVVARYSNTAPTGCGYEVALATPHKDVTIRRTASGQLTLEGRLAGNKLGFEAVVQVLTDGKFVSTPKTAPAVKVEGAHYIEVYLTAATEYKNSYPDYRGNDPEAQNKQVLVALKGNSYDSLKAEHIRDYRSLFDRVSLELGTNSQTDFMTAERQLQYGMGAYDPALEALFFQWGRYLLISSSRPGTLPAHLQGKWNNSANPPWACDYHMNINLQMIYWPAPLTGLPEVNRPLIDYILSLREPGRVTAREFFNARGWSVHTMNNPLGYTAPGWEFNWGYAPNSASWLAQHLWEQFAFYPDTAYLRSVAYPVMKELAHFWFDYLSVDPRDSTLVSSPSYSPEHGAISAGATMDQEIAWDLFTNILEADRVLPDADRAFIDSVAMVRQRLSPLKIGRYGQLQEWKADLDDPQDNHRHVSHLFALHPGRQIAPQTDPKLAEAARKTLVYRGDDGTGWSLAWKINFWARLQDGDHAYTMSRRVLRPAGGVATNMATGGGSYSNLFCAHPPYQMDGNMGYVSGVTEMLLQSHTGTVLEPVIDLLPALPAAWPQGKVRGLHARGGYTVDMVWENGKLAEAVIRACENSPETVTVRYRGTEQKVSFSSSERQSGTEKHLKF